MNHLSGSPSKTATVVQLPGIVEPEDFEILTIPMPQPGPGQVRIHVEATGISFAEQQMRRGKYYDQPAYPFVPGYDLVGLVDAVGDGVERAMIGQRYAAITKIGGWTTAAIVDAGDLVAVPDGVSAVDAETLVVNGLTAWQMLYRTAKVTSGDVILVLGANGGVGSTLAQLAIKDGIRVIGTASERHHDALQGLGVEPLDYHDVDRNAARGADLTARVRDLAPDGVDAVFDHVGGRGIGDSWRLLAKGGTLVSYGSASTRDDPGASRLPVLKLLARIGLWNLLPNGKHASFFNVWTGRRNLARFRVRLQEDLGEVFQLLASGDIHAQVAAQFSLTDIAAAMRLAESKTASGKVVLVPDAG